MDSQFFDDLGMSSLLVAHFCARARERADSPPVSVKDVYLHPTIRSLAATVTELTSCSWRRDKPAAAREASRVGTGQTWRVEPWSCWPSWPQCSSLRWSYPAASAGSPPALAGRASTAVAAFSAGAVPGAAACRSWVNRPWQAAGRRRRSRSGACLTCASGCEKPGPGKSSGAVHRFDHLPAVPAGTGVKIGRRVVIFSRTVPVGTDMLTIGDDTVIRQESSFTGYRAVAGIIETGPVSIGSEALIGEHTLLDIGTPVGDGSQLGNTSTRYQSQAVPDGQRWHGSPAQRTDVDYRSAEPIPSGPLRRAADGTLQLLSLTFVTMPLAIGAAVVVLTSCLRSPRCRPSARDGSPSRLLYGRADPLDALFAGAILIRPAVVVTVPRVLRRLITPGCAYPLYGLHHSACDLRILLGCLAIRSALVVAFAVDRLAGLGPVPGSPGVSGAGPGAFRRAGGSAQVGAETAESEPDPVWAELLSRLGPLVPGPAEVIH